MDFLVFLVLPNQEVVTIKILNPAIKSFLEEERSLFSKDDDVFLFSEFPVSRAAWEKIEKRSGRSKGFRTVHLYHLIALSGQARRKDVFEFTRKLQAELASCACLLVY